MKILLFGKGGRVGWELQRSLAPLGELVALDRHSTDYCGDLGNLRGIDATVRKLRPDLIVNAAAYTAVDEAESDVTTARTVNAEAPGVLAAAAQAADAWLVHYSTDYVFDGSGSTPWQESDPTGPLNVYGRSKLEGEGRIVALCEKHLILRTTWVYAASGDNFAKTMLRLAAELDHLTVIDDQFGAPTGADLLADITAHVACALVREDSGAGIYHVAAAGETSWHGYASYVLDYASRAGVPLKTSPSSLEPVSTEAFPTPAVRPHNSRFNTDKLRSSFDLNLPAWQHGVARMLSQII